MRKFLLFATALLTSVCLWAKQGGTLTSTPSPVDPSEDAVITYDGTGTNFADWEPMCYVHAWLVPADGQEFSKEYTTVWTNCSGEEDYAKLDDNLKMTYSGTKGIYSITINIKSFFGVVDADLNKIAKLGIIVKSQWSSNENDNVTNDLFVNVATEQPGPQPTQFVLMPTSNVSGAFSSGKPASGREAINAFNGSGLTDNGDGTYSHGTAVSGIWVTANETDKAKQDCKQWIAVKFNDSINLAKMHIWNMNWKNGSTLYKDRSLKDVEVYVSSSKAADLYNTKYNDASGVWTLAATLNMPQGPCDASYKGEEYALDKVQKNVTWVLFRVLTNYREGAASGAHYCGLSEVQFYVTEEEQPQPEVKYYAKNNWDAGEWSWLEMSATDKENFYMLDSVVFGGTGVNINTKEDDTDALWFAADAITVLDGLDGLPGPIPPEPRKRDTIPYAPAHSGIVLEAPQLLAGDTIKLFFNAADSTLKAFITGRPEQPQPAKTFDLTIVQDTVWSKDDAKIAAWIWADDLAGQWTSWATNLNDTLTLKVDERADSIILVRNAPEASEPTWDAWNRIDAGEIDDCHMYIITNWNEGVWCERPQPVGEKYYIKNNWSNGQDWTWVEMKQGNDSYEWEYTGVVGALGVNINTSASDADAKYYSVTDQNLVQQAGSPEIGTLDTVTFYFDSSEDDVVVYNVIGKYQAPTPVTPDYGLLVNGTDYLPGTPEDKGDFTEYAVSTSLSIGDFIQLYDNVAKAAWTVEPEGEGFTNFDIHDNAYYIKQAGAYQFYIKIPKDGMTSGLYVGFQGSGTNLNNLKAVQGQRFNVLGQPVGASYRGLVIMNGQKFLQR